jgi:hypothetical protein
MPGVIPSSLSAPLPIADDFIVSNDTRVTFINF